MFHISIVPKPPSQFCRLLDFLRYEKETNDITFSTQMGVASTGRVPKAGNIQRACPRVILLRRPSPRSPLGMPVRTLAPSGPARGAIASCTVLLLSAYPERRRKVLTFKRPCCPFVVLSGENLRLSGPSALDAPSKTPNQTWSQWPDNALG